MSDRVVDVTFPVTIRVRLDVANNPDDLERLRKDLERLVIYAADPEPGQLQRPLASLTPSDDGLGRFEVTVREPSTSLREYLYEMQAE